MPRESAAARKARAGRIVRALARAYPDAHCALHHRNPFELLIATILSAQCTDEKVNEVTPALFQSFPDARALAAADPARLERLIHPTGFYRQKAKSLLAAARAIAERFGNQVPSGLEQLTSLRGVARKTANVVRGAAFGEPALAVDTHMQRVHQRLGLVRSDEPDAIERELMELVPRREWIAHTFRAIHHGRVCCKARAPGCEACPVRVECPFPAAQRRQAPSAGRQRAAAR